MNIFILSQDMEKSAEMLFALDKRRANKQIVEISQCVSAVTDFLYKTPLPKKDGSLYKTTHQNHPCTRWIGASYLNVASTVLYGLYLCCEYRKLTGKDHGCQRALSYAKFMAGGLWESRVSSVTSTNNTFSEMPRFGKAMPNTGDIFADCLQHIVNKQNKEKKP